MLVIRDDAFVGESCIVCGASCVSLTEGALACMRHIFFAGGKTAETPGFVHPQHDW